MLIPGNTWQTVWTSAKAVPARRQKRLFDDTKEAEKILHFLESQTLGSIGQLTIPPLFHSAFIKLQKEASDGSAVRDFIPNYKDMEDKLKLNCCNLSREKWNAMKNISKKKWESVVNDISEMELSINLARSVLKKLYPDKVELGDDVSLFALPPLLLLMTFQILNSKQDKALLSSLMKCYDTELAEGAKNDIGVRVMYMFNLAKATQNEQRVEDHAWVRADE